MKKENDVLFVGVVVSGVYMFLSLLLAENITQTLFAMFFSLLYIIFLQFYVVHDDGSIKPVITKESLDKEEEEEARNSFMEESNVSKTRANFLNNNIELIDITPHVTFRLGESGWLNSFTEPTERCYHIQAWYRDQQIAVFQPKDPYVLNEEDYLIFVDDDEFIIFRKVYKHKKNK